MPVACGEDKVPSQDRILHSQEYFFLMDVAPLLFQIARYVYTQSESDYQEDLLKNPKFMYVRIFIVPMLLLPARLPTCLTCPI